MQGATRAGDKEKMMDLKDRKQGDILIIKPMGERLDASVATDFKKKMADFIDAGNEVIVLNMSEVKFIDSSGLGAFISLLKRIGQKGELVVCGMRASILSLFHMTRLNNVVRIYSREEEAVSDLSQTDDEKDIGLKRVRVTIDSDLENVALVGMIINKLCSLVPLSDTDSYQVELCVVEAVNNSIEHAYGMKKGHDVEVVFTLHPDRLIIDICDSGTSIDSKCLEQKDVSTLEIDPNDLDNIAEQGRGLPIMKEVMDALSYRTEGGKNCLTLIKNI